MYVNNKHVDYVSVLGCHRHPDGPSQWFCSEKASAVLFPDTDVSFHWPSVTTARLRPVICTYYTNTRDLGHTHTYRWGWWVPITEGEEEHYQLQP